MDASFGAGWRFQTNQRANLSTHSLWIRFCHPRPIKKPDWRGVARLPHPCPMVSLSIPSLERLASLLTTWRAGEQWRRPLPKPDAQISASPILIDDKIIIVCDIGPGSFVEALDKKTGKFIWRTERERVRRSFSTPFHWVNDKRDETHCFWILLAPLPTIPARAKRTGNIAARRRLIPPRWPPAPLLIAATAQNLQGSGESADGDSVAGSLTNLGRAESAVLAIRACGRGEINQTHLAWKMTRSLPDASSPVIYRDRLFTVKAGGFVSAYDLKDGKPIYQNEAPQCPRRVLRFPPSPLTGRIYFISQKRCHHRHRTPPQILSAPSPKTK